jgi:hypothetical protein
MHSTESHESISQAENPKDVTDQRPFGPIQEVLSEQYLKPGADLNLRDELPEIKGGQDPPSTKLIPSV